MRVNTTKANKACKPYYAVFNSNFSKTLAGFTTRGEAREFGKRTQKEVWVARVKGKKCGKPIRFKRLRVTTIYS